jgi:hypothetical protein
MWLVHRSKECTFVCKWKTSYMDTNRIHIKIYPNWFNFFPYYNKNTILVQLVVAHTIHQTQGLTLDYLAFKPTSVYKHGLTYKYFLVKNKEIFLSLSTFTNDFFSNWSKCCHINALFTNNHLLGCTHP